MLEIGQDILMLSFFVISLFGVGCTPTCEQTCAKLLSCDAVVTTEMECENACSAQEQLFDDWADMEQAETEEKDAEDQERSESENSGETYSPTNTPSQATQQSEDEEPSSKYQEAFDVYKICVSDKTCGEIVAGDCYNEDIYSW